MVERLAPTAAPLVQGLDFHSFRRSYITHLIEKGMDARFVQEQGGHDRDLHLRVLRLPYPHLGKSIGRDDAGRSAAGEENVMARQISYQWRLREVMATRGIFAASDLSPLLAERGVELSSVQGRRLVTQTSDRLSLPVLAALCAILDVTPTDLIATRAENVARRRTAASGGADVVDLANSIRPKRARITTGWGSEQLLPGRNAAGSAICRDCAGISRDFLCDRRGFGSLLLGGRLCERCTLPEPVTALLLDYPRPCPPAPLPSTRTRPGSSLAAERASP